MINVITVSFDGAQITATTTGVTAFPAIQTILPDSEDKKYLGISVGYDGVNDNNVMICMFSAIEGGAQDSQCEWTVSSNSQSYLFDHT